MAKFTDLISNLINSQAPDFVLEQHPKFLEWVLATDKLDHTKMWKKNISSFERIFLDLGAEVSGNITRIS